MRLPEQHRENNLEPNSVAFSGPNLAKEIAIDIWFEVSSNLSPCLAANEPSSILARANSCSRCVTRDNNPDRPIDKSVMKRSMRGAEVARPGYLHSAIQNKPRFRYKTWRTMTKHDARCQNLLEQAMDRRVSTGTASSPQLAPVCSVSAR